MDKLQPVCRAGVLNDSFEVQPVYDSDGHMERFILLRMCPGLCMCMCTLKLMLWLALLHCHIDFTVVPVSPKVHLWAEMGATIFCPGKELVFKTF